MPSAAELLRELRPPKDSLPNHPADPRAAAMLERILDADVDGSTSASRVPRGPGVRRVLAGGLASAAVAGAMVLMPVGDDSPDVLARAAAALSNGDAILHVKAVRRGIADNPDQTEESWQTTDGRRLRTLFESGWEIAQDWDARTNLSYSAARNEVVRHTDPDLFPATGPKDVDEPSGLGYDALGDLQSLLEQARGGTGSVRRLADTHVDGRPVHQIEITFPFKLRTSAGEARSTTFTRLVFVDRDDYLPVRVVERAPRDSDQVTDFVQAERLARTPENEAKLRLGPHPGARAVVEEDESPFKEDTDRTREARTRHQP